MWWRPLLRPRDQEAVPSGAGDLAQLFRAFRQAEEGGMVAAFPRRHRDVPRLWRSALQRGEDGE